MALEFYQAGSGNLDADDLAHRYLWGPTVDQLFADEQVDWSDSDADGEVLWALTDHLGSVRDVVDSNGKLRIHRDFDGFGNIVDETHFNASGATVTSGQTGYVDEAFAFTGRYFDKDTGLQNNLNRWYDPAVGRWTSEDPSGFDAGDANLYRYVGNAPTNHIDPFGLTAIPAEWWWTLPALPALPAAAPVVVAGGAAVAGPVAGYHVGCKAEEAWGIGAAIGNWLVPGPIAIPGWPGNDPTIAPPGTAWRGKPGSFPGSKEGNYYNEDTGECFRPDLDHKEPIGPHWDYRDPNGDWWRLFPHGGHVRK